MNSTFPRITWLLPVRNGMPYLREALASLAAQTYSNAQILALDDGSTDDSASELRRWIGVRLTGRIIKPRSCGLGAALAQLVEEADTDLCARMDSDDISAPERLEAQVHFMQRNPGVAVVGGNIHFIDSNGRGFGGAWTMPSDDAEIRWRLRFCNAINHPTVMFRRSAVLSAGNYRDMQPGQDYDLWLRIARGHEFANLTATLLYYRQHDGSISATSVHTHSRRQRTERYLADLFPTLSTQQAQRLIYVLTDWRNPRVHVSDIHLLHRAAGALGSAVKHDRGYFRQSSLYRAQMRSLIVRCARNIVLYPFTRISRSAA